MGLSELWPSAAAIFYKRTELPGWFFHFLSFADILQHTFFLSNYFSACQTNWTTFYRACFGSKILAKIISRQQTTPLAGKKLNKMDTCIYVFCSNKIRYIPESECFMLFSKYFFIRACWNMFLNGSNPPLHARTLARTHTFAQWCVRIVDENKANSGHYM